MIINVLSCLEIPSHWKPKYTTIANRCDVVIFVVVFNSILQAKVLAWSGPWLGFLYREGMIASGEGTSRVGGLGVSSPRKFSNLEAPKRYFQHFSRDMYPKNRPRISVKRQMFSVLTSAYFRGPVNLKHTVYSTTSTLKISQYCMM